MSIGSGMGGWGFSGLDGALVAVEFLARFDVTFCRLAPAGQTDLYSLSMGSTSRLMGLGSVPCACASVSRTFARLVSFSPLGSQPVPIRVDGCLGGGGKLFLVTPWVRAT